MNSINELLTTIDGSDSGGVLALPYKLSMSMLMLAIAALVLKGLRTVRACWGRAAHAPMRVYKPLVL